MDREKMIARHYLETGILGSYETAEVVHEEEETENMPLALRTLPSFDKTQTTTNRSMCIEGRRYRICSVFPVETNQTPTDKLFALIDTELEKETHSA